MSGAPPVLPDDVVFQIIDVAELARQIYGGQERASAVIGRTVPEHDYRFCINIRNGAEITFGRGTTATGVIEYLRERGDIT